MPTFLRWLPSSADRVTGAAMLYTLAEVTTQVTDRSGHGWLNVSPVCRLITTRNYYRCGAHIILRSPIHARRSILCDYC